MIAFRRPAFLPDPDEGESTFVGTLLRSETVGGVIALVAAAVAVLWVNLDPGGYDGVRQLEIGPLDLEHWAADGALALFFFVAGLELKREFLLGSLRRPVDAAVPVVAAIFGVALPALVFVVVNRGTENLGGWAIPAATDIAFALAVLAIVGSALPSSLRAFLLTLAVVDDLIVIVIIAVFYTDTLDLTALAGAAAVFAGYAVCQRLRVSTAVVYVPVVLAGWWLLHESGIHATIAGVVLGLLTRVIPDDDEKRSPAERLEHRLSPVSAGVAVPFFALMSAGVALSGAGDLVESPLVITRAELDDSLNWRDVTGVAVLGGVGFTVSLLVSDLSFSGTQAEEAKTAVLIGSVVAALLGAAILGRRNRLHQRT